MAKASFIETVKRAWGPYRRLYSYVNPYRWRFVLGIVLGVLFGAVSSAFPLVVARVTGFIFHGVSADPNELLRNRHALDAGGKFSSTAFICLLIPIAMTTRSMLAYGSTYYMNWVSNRVVTDVRDRMFTRIIFHSMDFFNRMRSGILISQVANDSRSMQMALTIVSADIFKQPVAIIGAVGVLLYLDWKFTLVALVLFPTCIIPIRLFGKRARKAVRGEQEEVGQLVVTMQETFSGIRVIKSFARERYQEKTFKRSNAMQFANAMRMIRATEITGPLIEAIGAIGVGLALGYVYASNLSAGRFFGLITGMFLLYDPVKTLSKLHVVMQRSVEAMTGIFALLDSQPTVEDAPDATTLTHSAGSLAFDNVSLRYLGTSSDAVQGINLRIDSGKSYALVGASGAGKSTMLSLILRFYDPTSGVVRIDGKDVRTLTQQSLRQQIGVVTQDTFLFHDTIYNNIVFGRLDATREEVYAAAQMAFAHDFILAQPQSYDTVVGDKGMLLSGGQQQRLAIARAILKNAPILLLDEATSALDSESEQQIQAALQRLASGKTVVAIAHRLSTILSSDQIVVMDGGHIKEVGTHEELLAKSGYYRRLYDIQFNRSGDHRDPKPEELAELAG